MQNNDVVYPVCVTCGGFPQLDTLLGKSQAERAVVLATVALSLIR